MAWPLGRLKPVTAPFWACILLSGAVQTTRVSGCRDGKLSWRALSLLDARNTHGFAAFTAMTALSFIIVGWFLLPLGQDLAGEAHLRPLWQAHLVPSGWPSWKGLWAEPWAPVPGAVESQGVKARLPATPEHPPPARPSCEPSIVGAFLAGAAGRMVAEGGCPGCPHPHPRLLPGHSLSGKGGLAISMCFFGLGGQFLSGPRDAMVTETGDSPCLHEASIPDRHETNQGILR